MSVNILLTSIFLLNISHANAQVENSGMVSFPARNVNDPSAYFELNETKEFTNFTIEFLLYLMKENPTLEIKFGQTINKQETVKTAEKRMKNFERSLKKGGVNMSRITFDQTLYYLSETDSNQQSRIQGVVTKL